MLPPSGIDVAPLDGHDESDPITHLPTKLQALSLRSSSRIFTTYELVEAMLLRMTALDVCIAATVCRYWKEVIESSKALKHHLAKIRPTPAHVLGLWPSQINKPNARIWHFVVKASHGRLIVTRVHGNEAMLFVPRKARERLRLLDGRYGRQVILAYDYNPSPDIFQWCWPRGKTQQKIVCRTKGKFCLLRQYLIETFPILREWDQSRYGRLGIRYPLYEWKAHMHNGSGD